MFFTTRCLAFLSIPSLVQFHKSFTSFHFTSASTSTLPSPFTLPLYLCPNLPLTCPSALTLNGTVKLIKYQCIVIIQLKTVAPHCFVFEFVECLDFTNAIKDCKYFCLPILGVISGLTWSNNRMCNQTMRRTDKTDRHLVIICSSNESICVNYTKLNWKKDFRP